jgi:sugar O-acyltransferase (sialic acid O-acetyltransferase NeuD family)
MKRLLIVGAGGHGRCVAEAVLASGEFLLAGFLDDAFPELTCVWDIPVQGRVANFAYWRGVADFAFVAIGNNVLRQQVTGELQSAGFSLATVIHPRAIVSPTAVIGEGAAIMAGGIVGTEARLGVGVIVNCAAVVDHHCQVGDFGHLGVGAVMAGGSVLGTSSWIQAGSSLGYGVMIEAGRVLVPGEAVS